MHTEIYLYLYLSHCPKVLYVSKCHYDLQAYTYGISTLSWYEYLPIATGSLSTLPELSVCAYIHRECHTLFACKLFSASFMHILPVQLYFLKGRDCVLNSICLHQHWAKSGLYIRCLKMLLRWVPVKYSFKKCIKKKTLFL